MNIGSLSGTILEQIDAARDGFEAAWRAGGRPKIEDFLTTGDSVRPTLLRAMIAREREIRRAKGERPTIQEYLDRFPDEAEHVHRAFEDEDVPVRPGPLPDLSAVTLPPVGEMPKDQTTTLSSPVNLPEPVDLPPVLFRDPPSSIPRRIGDFRTTRLLGQGGFGQVYHAWDEQLDRAVALKVALPGALGGREREEALLAEARLAAGLRHPGIVTVYRVGRIDGGGSPFVALEYVEGPTLAQLFGERGRLSFDRLASIVLGVAEAIHHAHEHRVIHRDLKPANILIDERGGPRVTDFGLALREGSRRPKIGEVAGTPGYMAPEQVRGESHRLDGRTDLWALGVTLYQGLTGRLPFEGRVKAEIYREILEREPRAPRHHDDRIPVELERICLKCLSKRMSDRHGSAMALAEDLRAWLGSPGVSTHFGSSTKFRPLAHTAGEPVRVVPKGLRAFDRGDADLFLDLMPGPRGRDGVPDSVRAWQSRIVGSEEGVEPFSVGLLYGPSGGGKSSFVKAGLLPRLDPSTTVICLDATPLETEAHLLTALRRRLPDLEDLDDLPSAIAALRARGEGPGPASAKVLIVLDQFEQWLQAHPDEADAPMVLALRQCDGRQVQAMVLVRDDFWTTVARFFKALEVPLIEGVNSSPVELPDSRHARTVLEAFGRSCNRFNGPGGEPSSEESKFLDLASDGLAGRDGRVIPVRLSLLVEVVRRRPWTSATLRGIGGVDGIGLTFLRETFDSPSSSPLYRAHARAAGLALQALLPPPMSVLKAPARPAHDLRVAAGYVDRPDDFRELVAVLDRDLRLISVVEPEAACSDPKAMAVPSIEPSYQLAHDDLVEAIRRWVEGKERSTRAGRARLRLASIAASYAERPERRRLPSLTEWLGILASTRSSRWSTDEHRVMGAATRLHLGRAAAILAIGGAVGAAIQEVRSRDRAEDLLRRAVAADPLTLKGLMPEVLRDLSRLKSGAARIEADSSRPARDRRSAGLIAYHAGPTPSRADALLSRLPIASPEEVELIVGAVADHPEHAKLDRLRARLVDDATEPSARLRLAASLVRMNPPLGVDFGPTASSVALALLGEERRTVPAWLELLGPVLIQIAPPLGFACADADRDPASRSNAAEALGALFVRRRDAVGLAMATVQARPDAAVVLLQGLRRVDDPRPARDALRAVLAEPPANPTDDPANEALAGRKARAAVALAVLGEPEILWPLLGHRDDPRLRTRTIHTLARSDLAGALILPRLARRLEVTDPAERQALLMTLAEASPDAIEVAAKGAGPELVASIHADDPDVGVHSAARLLLRRWKRDELATRPNDRGDRKLPPTEVPHRGWIVGPNGHTFAVFRGPLTFRMGSPTHEADRFVREAPHVRRIDRSLAVATAELTDAQFRAFFAEHAPDPRHGTEPDGPAHELTWFQAVSYCNWLSRQAGLEPCYPDPAKKDGKLEVEIAADAVSKNGFRLPTEAEWEFFARAGTLTARSFGSSDELLPRYGWTWLNSENRTHPVGLLLPNEFGLFDTLGNVWEFCHEGLPPNYKEKYRPYPSGTSEAPAPDPGLGGPAREDVAWRTLRGGSFPYAPAEARSANRYMVGVTLKDAYLGLRVVRTLP